MRGERYGRQEKPEDADDPKLGDFPYPIPLPTYTPEHTPSHSPQKPPDLWGQGWSCFCVVGGVPMCLRGSRGPSSPLRLQVGQGRRWLTWHGPRKGVSLGRRAAIAEAVKGTDWGSEAQRQCVSSLKSHSALASHT